MGEGRTRHLIFRSFGEFPQDPWEPILWAKD
jgi:hypothetical protein